MQNFHFQHTFNIHIKYIIHTSYIHSIDLSSLSTAFRQKGSTYFPKSSPYFPKRAMYFSKGTMHSHLLYLCMLNVCIMYKICMYSAYKYNHKPLIITHFNKILCMYSQYVFIK